MPARFLNAPNVISVLRVCCVPAIVYLMYTIAERPGDLAWDQVASFWAAALYGIAAFSDIVDGFIARRYGIVTVFGKLFDPLADKLLTFGALIMLIPLGRMSAWLAVLVIAREVAVTTLRGIASGEGIVIAADRWGKMKSAFTNAGLPLITLYHPHFGIEWFYVGWLLFLGAVVLGLGSGIHYGIRFFQQLTAREPVG